MSIISEVNRIVRYASKLGFTVETEEAATGSHYVTVYCANFSTTIRVSDHDPRVRCNADYFVDPAANNVLGACRHIDKMHVEAIEDEEAAEELSFVLAERKKLDSIKREYRKLVKRIQTERFGWILTPERTLWYSVTVNTDSSAASLKHDIEVMKSQFEIEPLTQEEIESQLAAIRAKYNA